MRKRRALGYWMVLATAALALLAGLLVTAPLVVRASAAIAPRMPWLDGNLPVYLVLDRTDDDLRARIAEAVPGLPAYTVVPDFRLAALVDSTADDAQSIVLKAGIFPDEGAPILREDTRFELRFQAPSLALLYQDLMERRGDALRGEASALVAASEGFGERALDALREPLDEQLGDEVAGRLWRDPLVRDSLKHALFDELARIDGDRLMATIGDSPELDRIARVAWGGIDIERLTEEFVVYTADDVFRRTTQRFEALKRLVDEERGALRLVFRLADQAQSCLRNTSRCISRELAPSVATGIAASGRIAVAQGVAEIADSDRAKQDVMTLGTRVVGSMRPAERIQAITARLRADPYLGEHLAQYGDKAMDGLVAALAVAWQDNPGLREEATAIRNRATDLARNGLRDLMLDQRRRGPNPFLLAMVRETLEGRLPPQVFVYPGQGAPVRPGHRFALVLETDR